MSRDLLYELIEALTILPGVGKKSAQRMALYLLDKNRDGADILAVTLKNAIKEIQKSTIGILLNSSENLHSFKYTSPLKYFEYLYGGLNIIANNFPANRVLPHQDRIQYFEEESVSDFVKAFNASITPNEIKRIELKDIPLHARTRKILKLY